MQPSTQPIPPVSHSLLLLACLYTLQSVIGSLTFQGMPAIFRQSGVAPDVIGLVYLFMLPWALKFLWAAPCENWRRSHHLHTRKLFVLANGLAIGGLLLLTQFEPASSLAMVFTILAVVALLSATVDTGLDGYAMQSMPPKHLGWLNVMQIGGGYMGAIIGGGLFLMMIAAFDWQVAVLMLAMVMLVLLLPALKLVKVPVAESHTRPQTFSLSKVLDNPRLKRGLLAIVFIQLGLRLVQGMSMPFMVDRGVSLAELGLAVSLGSSVISLAAVMLAGALIRKFTAWPVLLGLMAIQLVIYVQFCVLSQSEQVTSSQLLIWFLINAGIAAASFVALYTLMMGWASKGQAGVDFSVFQSMDTLVALVAGVSSGVMVQHLGYSLYFVTAVALTALTLAVLLLARYANKRKSGGEYGAA